MSRCAEASRNWTPIKYWSRTRKCSLIRVWRLTLVHGWCRFCTCIYCESSVKNKRPRRLALSVFYNEPTPLCRVLLAKPMVPQPLKKFPAVMEPGGSRRVHKSRLCVPALSRLVIFKIKNCEWLKTFSRWIIVCSVGTPIPLCPQTHRANLHGFYKISWWVHRHNLV